MRRLKRTIIANRSRQASTVVFCLLGWASAGKAQSVISAPPTFSTVPPAVQADLDEHTGVIQNWLTAPAFPGPADLFNWGPVAAHPHLTYQVLYGDGLQSTPGKPTKSIVQQFSPGSSFVIGSHLTIDYTPTLTFYSSRNFHDSLDQSASLNWGTHYEDWIFGVVQSYSQSSDPLVQTGTQTSTEGYATSLSASYRFNSSISVDTSASQTINSADQFSSSRSWETLEWLNYQFWPRLTGSIGAGYGYDNVNSGSDMEHESLQLRINWRATDKLSVSAHGGEEDRQFLDSGLSDLISPTYGASIEYDPLQFTALSLTLDRGISPAITSGSQASENTSLSISLNQRLLKRLQLSVSGVYNQVNYLASALNLGPERSDTYYSFSSRLSLAFLRRASASISYQYSRNSSTMNGLGFSSSQIGMQLSYEY